MARRPKYTAATDVMDALISEAWTLTDEEIESITPGHRLDPKLMMGAAHLVDNPADDAHIFTNLSREDREQPHVHLLKAMRDPNNFGFTCRNLFVSPTGAGPLEILPFQQLILNELWWRPFPMFLATRGASKSFLLALYSILRATFCQGSKIVIVAAAFRQAKAVFEYIERLWHNSPVYRDLVNASSGRGGRKNGPRRDIDRVEFVVGDSTIIGLPMGTGEKIRGIRANYVLADELGSINEEVYTVVVQGFGAVSADPVQNVKDMAAIRMKKRLGAWTEEMQADESKRFRGNQSVMSGTASYRDNHFFRSWQHYHDIIETKGDKDRLEAVLGGEIPPDFSWRDYSIIRLPHDVIPHGYMDGKTVSRAKQMNSSSQYAREFLALFPTDTDGFFRRSLVQKCVVGRPDDPSPPVFESCGQAHFTATIAGDPTKRYVFGVDPASESDRFAVVVLEVWPDHRRVVYCWTTRKSDHREKLRKGNTEEHDFYRYAVRKIRDLMSTFPAERVVVDQGGGGVALREAFGDPDKLKPGEQPIYEVEDKDKPKDTDDLDGHHCLVLYTFNDSALVSASNHSLKKDMEDRVLLYPSLDSVALGLALEADVAAGRAEEEADRDPEAPPKRSRKTTGRPFTRAKVATPYDTLEECMLEVEALKDELTTIEVTSTPTGKEHWGTAEKKRPGDRPGKLKKDRYSALLMANWVAREMSRNPEPEKARASYGGFAHDFERNPTKAPDGPAYAKAPRWFQRATAGGLAYGGSR